MFNSRGFPHGSPSEKTHTRKQLKDLERIHKSNTGVSYLSNHDAGKRCISQLVFEFIQTPQVLLTHCAFLAHFNGGKSFFSYQIDEQTMSSGCAESPKHRIQCGRDGTS